MKKMEDKNKTPKRANGHGGARPGAGRKRVNEKNVTFRAPKDMVDHLEKQACQADYIRMCISNQMKSEQEPDPRDLRDLMEPLETEQGTIYPMWNVKPKMMVDTGANVAAGPGIWADNGSYAPEIDLWSIVVDSYDKHAIMHVRGNSMIDAGINDGDTVIIDTTVQDVPESDIALCEVDLEYNIKHVHRNADGTVDLISENAKVKPIHVDKTQQFAIRGKVTAVLKKL